MAIEYLSDGNPTWANVRDPTSAPASRPRRQSWRRRRRRQVDSMLMNSPSSAELITVC